MSLDRWTAMLAAAGLPGAPRHRLPDDPLDPDSWSALLGTAQQIGMAGLLDRLIDEGQVPATDRQAGEAELLAYQAARNGVRLDRLLADVGACLVNTDVDVRVLKGAATAHLDHVDPNDRLYGDIDLLVRGPQLGEAIRTLAAEGFARDLPERRPDFDVRFGKEVPMERYGVDGVDLHSVLALGAFGFALPHAALWPDPESYEVGGVTLRALPVEGRLLHACTTVELGDQRPRVNALRDVALLSWHVRDHGKLFSLAPPGRGLFVVRAALERCRRLLGDVVAPEMLDVAAEHEPSTWERRALWTYRTHGGTNTTELLGGVLGLETLQDRATYLRALLAPAPSYRRARRAAGRPREWRVGVRELRRSRRADP